MRKYTYWQLERRYNKLSVENTRRARKIDTPEAYEVAASRDRLIERAFFADCRRYLTENDL